MTVDPVAVVLMSTFGRGTCRRCLARVVWYQTVGGSWLPFSGAPTVHNVHRDETRVDRPMIGEITRTSLHWRECSPLTDRRRGARS